MNGAIADNRPARLLVRYTVLGLIAVIFLFPLVFHADLFAEAGPPTAVGLGVPSGLPCRSAMSA